MGDPISTGLAVGGSAIAGSQQAKKSKTAEKNRKKELLGVQAGMLANVDYSFAQQYGLQKKANAAMQSGYAEGIKDADRIEGQGIQAADRYLNAALGGADAGASARGMFGSSMHAGARMGAARQAGLYRTDAQIAASKLRTSAKVGLGQAKAQGYGALGGLHAYRAGQHGNILGAYFDFLAGQQFTSQAPDFSGLAKLFASGGGGGGPGQYGNSGPVNYQGVPYFLAAP